MKLPLLASCLLLFQLIAWSQMHDIKFNLISGKNGNSLGKINGIAQDPSGYMWFADQTQKCITRYNGYSMVSYRNDPLNDNSLGGTNLEWIISDASGIIWVGFNGSGLDRFDPEKGHFTHFRHHPNDSGSLSNDTVAVILKDRGGNLWVGSNGGLDLLDNKTGKFKHYRCNANDPTSLSNNRVRAIYEDRGGTLWVGAGSAYDGGDRPNEGGLNRFNRKTGTFTRYLNDPKDPNSLSNNKVRAIFEDSRGTFWIGTAGATLQTMDRKTGIFTRYKYNPTHPEQLSRPPVKDITDHVTFIIEDKTGAIWMGTSQAGLTRYDPVTKTVTRYDPTNAKATGFTADNGWIAYSSRDNVLWVSTEPKNLYYVDPFYIAIPHVASTGSVNSFFEEAEGVIWIATDSGIIRNDRNRKSIKRFIHNPRNPGSITNNNVSSICKDNRGKLWIGTNGGGLNKFDLKEQTFRHYKHNPENNNSLISNRVSKTFFEQHDTEGLLWIGTASGLDQLNVATGTFTHYQNNPKDSNSLSNDVVTDILQDKQKRLWVGTLYAGGLNAMNAGAHGFKHYLLGLDVNCVFQDSDGVIWAGTIEGLYRYDGLSDTFIMFTDIEKKVRYDNVASIVEDNERNLWMSTSEGIESLNRARTKFTIYGRNNGVENNLNVRAGYKGLNDELFFGDAMGYYHFLPLQANKNKTPEVLISDFRIEDNLVKPGKTSPLRQPLMKTEEIILSYNQNIFSFDFAAIDYRNPQENTHLFMLENYDKKWHTAGSVHTAYYYNVPPGHYTFKVKASSVEGLWAEKDISITIRPPWWRTWWAYTFFGIFFIGGIFIIDRAQRRRLISRERERAREMELLQAREIEKAYNELKRTQKQLIQTEKMASLGELTAGVAHEIQNPLNFVNNFSEVNKELVEEVEVERRKANGQRDEALEAELLNEIRQNTEKIISHGKRADAIVKGMLQHSRASSGKKEPTDINVLADEYLRLSYHGLRAKDKDFNATIETDFDESIGEIEVVPQDIGRVLFNLYNNAFYAVSERQKAEGESFKPIVKIQTKKVDSKVEVVVKDNGNGIPQNVINKIFQPFFTTKPTGQGTGLGLSLSYDIIKAHGGEIDVEAVEGQFTTFSIRLPAS
jgi:signal transduction histidine kinase/ligand-binding sensor domain-containing protein